MTAGAVVLGVSAWHLLRGGGPSADVHRSHAQGLGLSSCWSRRSLTSVVGHFQGQLHDRPAADEDGGRRGALARRTDHAPFSPVRRPATSARARNKVDLTVPDGLSLLATEQPERHASRASTISRPTYHGQVRPGRLRADRLAGVLVLPADDRLRACCRCCSRSGWSLCSRGAAGSSSPRLLRAGRLGGPAPFVANSAGWIFTETARQPWLVYGLLKTQDGVSIGLGAASIVLLDPGRVHPALRRARLGRAAHVPTDRSGRPGRDRRPERRPVAVTGTRQ